MNGQTVIKIFLRSFDFYLLTTQYIDHIRDITEKFRHGLCDWNSKANFENEEEICNRIKHLQKDSINEKIINCFGAENQNR